LGGLAAGQPAFLGAPLVYIVPLMLALATFRWRQYIPTNVDEFLSHYMALQHLRWQFSSSLGFLWTSNFFTSLYFTLLCGQ